MKTAIVFGATSGIGKEISELLLKDGYKVAITGRRLEKLEVLKKQYPNQVYVGFIVGLSIELVAVLL